jgi:ABC-2 type transport system permease protein
MRPAWAIIDRDLRKYLRSPALLLVSLFLPLVQLVIIGYAFGGKLQDISVALVDLDRGPEALRVRERLVAIAANARTFHVTIEDTAEAATHLTRTGKVAAAIVIPEEYSKRVNKQYRPQLGLVVDNTDPFVVSTLTQKMTELVEDLNRAEVPAARYNRRAALEIVEVFPFVEYIQYLLPGSITLSIFVCCLLGGGLLYIDDKARGFHEGYLVTPISKLSLLSGMLMSGTIKATFAGSIVTIVGAFMAGIGDLLNASTLVLLVLFNALISFSLITMISFMMVRVSDPLIPRATFGLLNTLLFFPSGAMYPIYGFPDWLKAVAVVDPFTYAVHGLRSVLLKQTSWEAIQGDVTFLGVFSIVCFAGIVVFFPRHL